VTSIAPFTLAIGPASLSRPVQEINDFNAWRLDNNLDDGCSITFSARGGSLAAQLISELETDVFVYRLGQLVQRFRVTSLEENWRDDGENTIDVSAICYRRILRSRFVRTPLTFTAETQGQIVADLIAHAQAADGGNLGITNGALESTILRDREYQIGQNIWDAITDLTRVEDGIAWDIDPALELAVRLQTDFPVVATPIALGTTARRLARPSSADQFANATIVVGNTQATDPVIAQTSGITTDPRGRWERFVSSAGEADLLALQERANGVLTQAISPVSVWQAEMVPSRYFGDIELEIGEFCSVVKPNTTQVIPVQVIARSISQTSEGDVLVVVSAIELP
jgi:hypothetical protein